MSEETVDPRDKTPPTVAVAAGAYLTLNGQPQYGVPMVLLGLGTYVYVQ